MDNLTLNQLVTRSYQAISQGGGGSDADARFYRSVMTPQFTEVVQRYLPYRDAVTVKPSPIHGNGLFATRDIPADQLVTVYPVHYFAVGDGKIFNLTGDPHCQPDKTVLRDYCVNVEGGMIVGDPNRVSDATFLSHIANDGSMLQNTGNLALDVIKYLDQTCQFNNCRYQHIGPLVALKTVKPVNTGDELLASYHWSYWIPRSYGTVQLERQLSEIANSVKRLKFPERKSVVRRLQRHDPVFENLKY